MFKGPVSSRNHSLRSFKSAGSSVGFTHLWQLIAATSDHFCNSVGFDSIASMGAQEADFRFLGRRAGPSFGLLLVGEVGCVCLCVCVCVCGGHRSYSAGAIWVDRMRNSVSRVGPLPRLRGGDIPTPIDESRQR